MAVRKGRFSNKRSDKRFIAPDGTVWASKFEQEVYVGFRSVLGPRVRPTVKGSSDTIPYATAVRTAKCLECGNQRVVQSRTYTPDLHVDSSSGEWWVEAKGYFQPSKRTAFRGFRTWPDTRNIVVRFVLERNNKATKSLTMLEYFQRYFKGVDVIVWKGPESIPKEWLE
jgi:hypothetical protein